MTASFEKLVRMRFLKIGASYFIAGDVRGNGQHRHPAAMTIVEAINRVHIARAAASGADRQFAGQMRLRSGGKVPGLFMAERNPFDVVALAASFKDPVERISDHSVDSFDSRGPQ